jgi:hypothetical protein
MGPLPTYRVGMNNFWRRVNITSSTSTDLIIPPASTMATGGTNRAVITELWIAGRNTNASICTVTIRNKTTTGSVILYREMAATTGTLQDGQVGLWIPGHDGETIQVVTANLTGFVEVFVGGMFLPSSTTTADKYTGAP